MATTMRDIIRDFGKDVNQRSLEDNGMTEQNIEEKVDEYMQLITERIVG